MTKISSIELQPNTPIETEDALLEISVEPSAPLPPGQHIFRLVVTDDSGNQSAPAEIEIIIRDSQAPTAVLDVEPSRTLEFGASFRLSAERSSDVAPGQLARFSWTLVSRQ
jgi:hypothetical protein